MKVDAVIKERAEQEEAEGKYGVMSDLRDSIEDVILHCHLAWQYHRLSKAVGSASTWDRMELKSRKKRASTQEKGSELFRPVYLSQISFPAFITGDFVTSRIGFYIHC
jgi:hypothetical protein